MMTLPYNLGLFGVDIALVYTKYRCRFNVFQVDHTTGEGKIVREGTLRKPFSQEIVL